METSNEYNFTIRFLSLTEVKEHYNQLINIPPNKRSKETDELIENLNEELRVHEFLD